MGFNLSAFGEGVAKDIIPQIVRGFKEPVIPELHARGTPEAPTMAVRAEERGLPVRPFAPGTHTRKLPSQYHIDPEVEGVVSQTYKPTSTAEDTVQKYKSLVLGLFSPTPNLPKDLKTTFLRAKQLHASADEAASADMASYLKPLLSTQDAAFNTTMLFRQMKIADIVEHMNRNNLDAYGGVSRDKWIDSNTKMLSWLRDNPAIMEAHGNLRSGFDDIFNDMVNRGWITPERYLKDYTPMMKINSVISSLGHLTGEGSDKLKSRVLSMMRHRPEGTEDEAIDEGNLLYIMTGMRTEYYRKVAEHELFLKILNDPTLNLTERYRGMQTLPEGVVAYMPGKGMIGSSLVSKEGRLLGQVADEMGISNDVHFGGWIIPKSLAEELNSFHPHPHTKGEELIVEGGRKFSKFMTVYNPANTFVNLISDFFLASLGLPGEKARPMGFLRWYGEGHKAAAAFVAGKEHLIDIGGQKVDISHLLLSEGVGESTFVNDVSQRKMNPYLKAFLPEEELSPKGVVGKLGDAAQIYRSRVELAPRIAAGLEALERTGDIKEFGRVARNITLNFGPGSPKLTKVPLFRFTAPFITFSSLATERVFKLATAEGSRGRIALAAAAVPVSVYMWNTQNKEYEAVNNSVSPEEKSSLRLILPDPKDPEKPMRDVNGKPVVIRLKYFVPEEVARFIGLGNLPNRIARLAQGRDTAKDFMKDVAKGPAQQWGTGLFSIPGMVTEQMTGKNQFTGREMSFQDRLERLFPVLKVPFSFKDAASRHGLEDIPSTLGVGTEAALRQFTGTNSMNTYTVGVGTVMDADLKKALSDFQQSQRDFKNAAVHGSYSDKQDRYKSMLQAREKLKKIVEIFRKSRGEEEAQRVLRQLSQGLREWDQDERDKYIDRQRADTRDVLNSELNM